MAKSIRLDNKCIKVKEFKMSNMTCHPTVCMIAKRSSGKSYLVRDILQHTRDIPCGVIISRTEKVNPFYKYFVPDTYIYHKFEPEILENIILRQSKLLKRGNNIDVRVFLVMDDCLASKGDWMNDDHIAELFFNGRHFKITFILTMQFPLGIKPEFRCNFDYIFLRREKLANNIKRLYEHYAGMFPSLRTFQMVFNQITDDYGAMVIDNRTDSSDIWDQIYWYKAKVFDDNELKKVGIGRYVKYHDNHYNKQWDDEDMVVDIMNIGNKAKNDIHIKIQKV